MNFILHIFVEMLGKLDEVSANKILWFAFFYLFNTYNAISSDIDKDHHKAFPYCGSMKQRDDDPKTKSRAINAEYSKGDYRWAAFLKRVNIAEERKKMC